MSTCRAEFVSPGKVVLVLFRIPLSSQWGKTCGEPVEPWCLPGAASTGDRYPGRLGSAIQPTMPESSTELSTSFALASQRSCIWLSSLVSLACSSGSVVIHSGVPTLRLMWRSSYLIVNQEIRDRPRQKTSRYPVHPAASKENNQAENSSRTVAGYPPRANWGFSVWLVLPKGSAQAEKTQAFQAQGDSYSTRPWPAELRVAPLGASALDQSKTKCSTWFQA